MNTKLLITLIAILLLNNQVFTQEKYFNFWQAQKLVHENKLPQAAPFFELACAENPRNQNILMQAAKYYILTNNTVVATQKLEQANAAKPHAADLCLAQIYASQNNAQKTFYYLNQHLNSQYAMAYAEISDNPAFAKYHKTNNWKNLWSTKNTKPDTRFNINYLIQQGKTQQAFELLDRKLYTTHPDKHLYLTRAQLHKQTNQLKNALHDVNQFLKTNKRSADALRLRAEILATTNKYQKALETVNNLLHIQPENIQNHLLKAQILAGLNKPQQAKNILRYINPYIIPTVLNIIEISQAYYQIHDYFSSLTIINQHSHFINKNQELLLLRAKNYLQTNNPTQAQADLNMLLDLNPRHAEAYYLKGNLLHQQNQQKTACDNWQKALRLGYNPANLMLLEHCDL